VKRAEIIDIIKYVLQLTVLAPSGGKFYGKIIMQFEHGEFTLYRVESAHTREEVIRGNI